ncbi:MAG: glucosaminidase domain-containing protein, partial [Desulfovibrionaceae bacterium]|nr:glucosaminidase domain-containing protein [Desulfovibrionaceae bacterium]
IKASFRAYGSWEQSVADHSAFLVAGARYAAVIGEGNYKKACTAIHKAGYATAPDYADKLIKLIETYGLTAFDTSDTTGEPAESKPTENHPTGSRPGASSTPVLSAAQKRMIAAWLLWLRRR